MRKPVQVTMDGHKRILVLCEDGTMWAGTWGMNGSGSWKPIPPIPEDSGGSVRNYEPKGHVFMDRGLEMMVVADDELREGIRGWLLYRHPDGQWVTLREATILDRKAAGIE